jgi:hypothetical protein
MTDDASFDVDAAELRADGSELKSSVEVLARKLEEALPQSTSVERKSKRFLSGDKVVRAIEVRLGEQRYSIAVRDRQRLDCAREQEVRGVVIKREPLDLDQWVDELTAALRQQAASNAQARDALERLLG